MAARLARITYADYDAMCRVAEGSTAGAGIPREMVKMINVEDRSCCCAAREHVSTWITARSETQMEVFPGISIDAHVRFGKPCIKGTRIDVASVLDYLAAGESSETIQDEYGLTREQILAALRYAAHVSRHLPPAVECAA